jgi:hypothetical protein
MTIVLTGQVCQNVQAVVATDPAAYPLTNQKITIALLNRKELSIFSPSEQLL